MGLVQQSRAAVSAFAEAMAAAGRDAHDLARDVRALAARIDAAGELGTSQDADLARARTLLADAERLLASAGSACRSAPEPAQAWVDRSLPG